MFQGRTSNVQMLWKTINVILTKAEHPTQTIGSHLKVKMKYLVIFPKV